MAEGTIQRIDLPITGMTCAGCVRNVERAMTKAENAGQSVIHLANGREIVAFSPLPMSIREESC